MSGSILVNEFVTDTMGLVLRVERRKLGRAAKPIFEAAEEGNAVIYVPALTFAEILYLSEKKRIQTSLQAVSDYLNRFPSYKEYSLDLAVVRAASDIVDIPELHDRIIAATAKLLGLALLTNDPILQASNFVQTIW